MKTPSKNKSVEEEYGITDPEGKPYEIPLGGSMGLLTLGYRGLMAWRAKKIDPDSYRDERKQQQEKTGDERGE